MLAGEGQAPVGEAEEVMLSALYPNSYKSRALNSRIAAERFSGEMVEASAPLLRVLFDR